MTTTQEAIAAIENKMNEITDQQRKLIDYESRLRRQLRREQRALEQEYRRLDTLRDRLQDELKYVTVAEVTDKDGQVHRLRRKRNDPDGPLRYNNYTTSFDKALERLSSVSSIIEDDKLDVVRALIILTAKH